jgi:hypothetical protein
MIDKPTWKITIKESGDSASNYVFLIRAYGSMEALRLALGKAGISDDAALAVISIEPIDDRP